MNTNLTVIWTTKRATFCLRCRPQESYVRVVKCQHVMTSNLTPQYTMLSSTKVCPFVHLFLVMFLLMMIKKMRLIVDLSHLSPALKVQNIHASCVYQINIIHLQLGFKSNQITGHRFWKRLKRY